MRAPGLALFVTAAALSLIAVIDLVMQGNLRIDFKSFYFASVAAREGGDIYDVERLNELAGRLPGSAPEGHVWPYIYPPLLAYALAPLSLLRLEHAQLIWALLSVTALGVALAASIQGFALPSPAAAESGAERRASLLRAVALAALLVFALPLRSNIAHGQVNLLVLALLVLSVRAHLSGKDVASGALLALAALIKVTPALFVVLFLARRRYKAALAFAAAAALLAAATLPFGALPAWRTFIERLPEMSYGAHIPGLFEPAVVWNFSPAGLLSRWLPDQRALIKTLCIGTTAALLVLAARLARRPQPSSGDATDTANDEASAVALFFPILVLASPLAYVHHVIYVAPAAAVWISRAWRDRHPGRLAALLGLLLLASTDFPPLYGRIELGAGAFKIATSLNLYALLGLVAVGLHSPRSVPRASPPGRLLVTSTR